MPKLETEHNTLVQLRISGSLKARLEQKAGKHGMSKAIRAAIEEWLERGVPVEP